MMNDLPPCCHYDDADPLAKKLYALYNAGGEFKGLNFRGEPCPVWESLPGDVRAKWQAVADFCAPGVVVAAGVIGTVNM